MGDYIAVAKIKYYTGEGMGYDGDAENPYREENVLITGVATFAEVVEKLEAYYGNDLDTIINLTLLEGPMLFISDETMNRVLTEDIL